MAQHVAMALAKPSTFGRRGGAAAPRASSSAGSRSGQPAATAAIIDDPELAAMARRLMAEQARESAAASERPSGGPVNVPWNKFSASLACLCAAALQAGALVVESRKVIEIIPRFTMDFTGDGSSVSPVYIGICLLRGARVAGIAVFVGHHLMRVMGQSNPIAYGLAGGAVGAAQAFIQTLLSHGHHNLVMETATGIAAGFLYRLFVGGARAPAGR